MQEDHPGTVISIKTNHTLNLLYHTVQQGIAQIRSRGVLDGDDCNLLEQSLKNMHIYQHIPSTMPPSSPMIAIHNLSWLFSNEQLNINETHAVEEKLLRALPNENSERFENEILIHPQTFSWQDFLWHKNDKIHGVYLIVNGIVEEWKLDPYDIDAHHNEIRWKEINRTRQVNLTPQQTSSPTTYKHVHYSPQNHQSTLKNKLHMNDLSAVETSKGNEVFTSALSKEGREIDSLVEVQSITTLEDDEKLLHRNTTWHKKLSDDDRLRSTAGVRVAFEDGFYIRWHHLMTNPMNEKFKDDSTIVDDDIHQYYHDAPSEEKFDELFNETFDKYRQIHPATSERVHHRYSYSSGDCIGLYDFLISNGEKYESTGKCSTNVTLFFIAKEKLFDILNSYSLWNVLWLEIGIRLALRILPEIREFQHSRLKQSSNMPVADSDLINKRLLSAGLLIFNEMTCSLDDVIHLNEDLFLIAGSVRNQITKCVYEAPIFIKQNLSKQGLKLLDDRSITKILVLPTTMNVDNIFVDSSLINHIIDIETKRDLNQTANDSEQFNKSQMKIFEHRTHERFPINEDSPYPQQTVNIDRSSTTIDNKF
ncbi:unnamed protein product [Rotaria magnacalcarata]|uniref:Cyclic nucleotide-binding domain-containing protein n=2 Tax=Rotaria magnacalcarata TaxID=392030 RepID=A0A814WP96_9BILA|nr:unnamed protein product [Rotaria magnacalcarata]